MGTDDVKTQSIVEKLIDEFENNEKFKKHNCNSKN